MGNLVSKKLVNGADVSSAAFCQSEDTDWEFCLYRGWRSYVIAGKLMFLTYE